MDLPHRPLSEMQAAPGPLGWPPAAWRLLAAWALGLTALCGWVLTRHGTSDAALGLLARNAARAGFLAFALAFGARPLRELLAPRLGSWLVRRRPVLGVAFALAHGLFLATNLTRVGLHYAGDPLALRPLTGWVVGGALFVLIFAMAATSFPAPARALGPRRWRLLHLAGGWLLLGTFLSSFGFRALADPFYVPFALAVLALAFLRAAAAFRRDAFGLRTLLGDCAARCLG